MTPTGTIVFRDGETMLGSAQVDASGHATFTSNHINSDAAREKASQNLETGRRRAQIKRGDPRSDAPAARQSR